METAELYVSLYPWYYMPPTVHKVLIHGAKVIREAIVPIGQLSEEALESRNKDIRKYRKNYTRKCSREKTNEDIFKRLLLSSDPYISQLTVPNIKTKRDLPNDIKKLLILEDE